MSCGVSAWYVLQRNGLTQWIAQQMDNSPAMLTQYLASQECLDLIQGQGPPL